MIFHLTILRPLILNLFSCKVSLETSDLLYFLLFRNENYPDQFKLGYTNPKYNLGCLEKARNLNCDELKVLYHQLDSIRKTYPRKAFKLESKYDSIQTLQWAVDLETRNKQCNKTKKFKLFKKPNS